MTGKHWFWLFVLIGNGFGMFRAWEQANMFCLMFAALGGYALCRLLYMADDRPANP